jgi:alpha-methylacyl-CoA racemase
MQVITLALNVPGPMAAERLRDLGATVTKVEPPQGDPLKASNPAWYARLTAGAHVRTCDLKAPTDRAEFDRWLGEADLLLTSQRPAALARLNLGWDELHTRFPRLCQVAMIGYPAPSQNVAGHDLTYLADNGLVRPPELPPTLFADVAGSEQAALAALAILLGRERGDAAQYVEVAIADAAERLAAPRKAGLTLAGAILGGGFPGYNLYRTKDGWVAVAALEPHFYRRLCEQLGVGAPSSEAMAARFALETNAYWSQFARDNDLPMTTIG